MVSKRFVPRKSKGWPVAISTGNPGQARQIVEAAEDAEGQRDDLQQRRHISKDLSRDKVQEVYSGF